MKTRRSDRSRGLPGGPQDLYQGRLKVLIVPMPAGVPSHQPEPYRKTGDGAARGEQILAAWQYLH